ncbi:uncharacterized protein EHS24_007797 [Apiotrichum porosum]|uniref:Uncharacterized protein n=1 Tax=Apiotrichum porosum TaxID=105984 RepID=A0A427XRZ3_9TREE|nr:uncharacterized protein EHS24_007797 [Apiotrichum porosum]RSH81619.1 hypothetical protein EHS24_007797 [Apiotrichum porosum]
MTTEATWKMEIGRLGDQKVLWDSDSDRNQTFLAPANAACWEPGNWELGTSADMASESGPQTSDYRWFGPQAKFRTPLWQTTGWVWGHSSCVEPDPKLRIKSRQKLGAYTHNAVPSVPAQTWHHPKPYATRRTHQGQAAERHISSTLLLQ